MKNFIRMGMMAAICCVPGIFTAQSIWAPSTTIGLGTTSGVGIGTASPQGSLDVRANCVSGNMATLLVTGNNYQTCIWPNAYGETFRVRTETAAGVFRNDFIIKSGNGRLGAGTFNPQTGFHLVTATMNDGIRVEQTGAHGATLGLYNTTTGGHNWTLFSTGTGNTQGSGHFMIHDHTAAQTRFFINGTTGNVGINTINPTAKLTVNGKTLIGDPALINITTTYDYNLYVQKGILTERLKVAAYTDGVNWSDYVFEPDYKRNSLSEVEKYVKANKHLPNMPGADEVYAEGIDVAQMDAALLRQIEELWLHMIDLKKENEELRAKLEQR